VPAVAVFLSPDAIFVNPKLLALPVMTLTAVELGYVVRMTRASMVEVMDSPYIRTAIIKGMPYWRVVLRHAVRNALMAPITIIMLHVNWLIGGVVVVEVIFGYPGLGKYIYDAAIFGDFYAVEAAAMLTVTIAIATRLIGDLAYTFLNPRIRYA
jgi:peptide/nickel transport system permease protein